MKCGTLLARPTSRSTSPWGVQRSIDGISAWSYYASAGRARYLTCSKELVTQSIPNYKPTYSHTKECIFGNSHSETPCLRHAGSPPPVNNSIQHHWLRLYRKISSHRPAHVRPPLQVACSVPQEALLVGCNALAGLRRLFLV